ncbi:MAG TPA: lipid-A-disaccharide synthase N-terminal domain-containing protein [Calidithermus sp.]|nr:lipid-A-disaccharide synthase N-terminal domain-containing protein [Calidithermus sp.]
MSGEQAWLAVGLLGQALFSARFLVQWIATERRRQSVVPRAFWYLSVGGGLVLLAYALYRHDPVFVLGQAAGLVVYARNLYFIHRRRPEPAGV